MKNDSVWDWAKSICAVVLSLGLAYKIVTIPIESQLDLPAILSIVLAVFSIGLAAAFYFKAEQSNREFQQNTYQFTKSTSELLGRIEAGFGEKLGSLDRGVISLSDKLENRMTIEKKLETSETDLSVLMQEKESAWTKIKEKIETENQELANKYENLNLESNKKQEEIESLRNQLAHGIYKNNNRLSVLEKLFLNSIYEKRKEFLTHNDFINEINTSISNLSHIDKNHLYNNHWIDSKGKLTNEADEILGEIMWRR